MKPLPVNGPALGLGRSPSFPFTQWQDDDPYRTVFFDEGQGDPLVLVHGLGGNITHWELVAQALARRRRVLALDLVGCGWSAKPRGPYTVAMLAAHLSDFLARRKIQRATLLGHSLGAAVCAKVALEQPDLVCSLALICPVGLVPLPAWIRMSHRLVLNRRLLYPVFRYGAKRVLAGNFHQGPRRNENARWFVDSTGTDAAGGRNVSDLARFTESIMADLSRADLSGRLAELRGPTLVLCGEQDRLTAPVLDQLATLPRARRVMLPGAGHLPFVERPEAFLSQLQVFLQNPPARRLAGFPHPSAPDREGRHHHQGGPAAQRRGQRGDPGL